MLIDLHCHTAPYSSCSSLSPAELLSLAEERGLDGVCLTEHDTWWPAEELEALRQTTSLLVVAGVEFTTDAGHALAFGIPAGAKVLASGDAVSASAAESGGVVFLAHPARDGLLRVTAETVRCFDSVEAANGSDSRLQNMAAAGLAKGFRLPGIGGSDAHTPAEVGRCATRFTLPVGDETALVAALRAGAYEAVHCE